MKRLGPPSTNAKASAYVKYQRGLARVLDGRSSIAGLDDRAPSIELYHPVFAQLRSDLSDRNRQVRPETVHQTLKLMQSVSQLAGQENERSESTRHLVSNLLGQQLIKIMNGNNTSPDHCVSVSLDSHEPMCTVTPLILEEKAEMGKTATDPSVQVQLSYLQYWMDPSVSVVSLLVANKFGDCNLCSAGIFLRCAVARRSSWGWQALICVSRGLCYWTRR